MSIAQTETDRERHLRALAERLQFTLEKHDGLFTLVRTSELKRAEIERGLTLEQAEELLRTWKLRGLGGG
jgi:hypothetical protein